MATVPARAPKSILKKPQGDIARSRSSPSASTTASDKNDKHRDIAIQHATIIQQRKDFEAAVLDSVVILSEFPLVRTPEHPATNPAASDVAQFKSHIRLFQPSDFDDLVIERNANGLCGYALCSRPNRRMGSGASWKLINMGKQDFDIVSKEELEKWCSQDCKRRALWIRIQLSETVAWERASIADLQIDLLGEDGQTTNNIDDTARELAKLQLAEQRRAEATNSALALERGDDDTDSTRVGLVDVVIREQATRPVGDDDGANEQDSDDDNHYLLTEGYKVKFDVRR
jgi:hypothetical protein